MIVVAITTFVLARCVYHTILALLYSDYCAECESRASDEIQHAADTLGARDPIAFQNWLRNARPGAECSQLCYNAGKQGLYAVVTSLPESFSSTE